MGATKMSKEMMEEITAAVAAGQVKKLTKAEKLAAKIIKDREGKKGSPEEVIQEITDIQKAVSPLADLKAYELAKRLLAKHNIKTLYGKKVDKMFRYSEGIYIPNAEGILKEEIEVELGASVKTNVVNEIINRIKRLTRTEEADLWQTDTNLVCVSNGILNLNKQTITPHTPDKILLLFCIGIFGIT